VKKLQNVMVPIDERLEESNVRLFEGSTAPVSVDQQTTKVRRRAPDSLEADANEEEGEEGEGKNEKSDGSESESGEEEYGEAEEDGEEEDEEENKYQDLINAVTGWEAVISKKKPRVNL